MGLKAEVGQFLHCMYCTAVLRSCSAEGWGLLKLVLSPERVLKLHFCEVSKWLVSWGMTPIAPSSECTATYWACACHSCSWGKDCSLLLLLQRASSRMGRPQAQCSQPCLSQQSQLGCVGPAHMYKVSYFTVAPLLPEGPGCLVMWDSHTCCLLFCPFFLSSYKDLGKRVGKGETLQVFEATWLLMMNCSKEPTQGRETCF